MAVICGNRSVNVRWPVNTGLDVEVLKFLIEQVTPLTMQGSKYNIIKVIKIKQER